MSTEAERAATVQRQKALSNAIQQEDTSQVLKMLRLGADVNTNGEWIFPPVLHAARHAAPEILRVLLVHGGDPNIINQYNTMDDEGNWLSGEPALLEAAQEMIDEAEDSICLPSRNKDVLECMTLLLDHGANVDALSPQGHTALHLMVKRAHPDAVRLLLARGANPTIRDTSGKNAFDYAQQPAEYDSAEERKVEIRQMLSQFTSMH